MMRARQDGQVTVEVAIGCLAVIAALVLFGFVYTQRAMQGSTFDANQSLNVPADPRDSLTDTSNSSVHDTTEQQPGQAMIEARTLKTQAPDRIIISGPWAQTITLGSLPVGPVPREPAGWRAVLSTANWNSNQSSNADVHYDHN